jgi:hypothetical protein
MLNLRNANRHFNNTYIDRLVPALSLQDNLSG